MFVVIPYLAYLLVVSKLFFIGKVMGDIDKLVPYVEHLRGIENKLQDIKKRILKGDKTALDDFKELKNEIEVVNKQYHADVIDNK